MKKQQLLALLLIGFLMLLISACTQTTTTTSSTTSQTTTQSTTTSSSITSSSASTTTQTGTTTTTTTTTMTTTLTTPIVYGLPTPPTGFYYRDADVIQLGDKSRYIVYVTNDESGEEDNVIAIRKGTFHATNGYSYGPQTIAIRPSSTGWDKYLGSASIVKGNFTYNSVAYTYLMAYQGTTSPSDRAFSIGFAVANDPEGTWVKVGTSPVLTYNSVVYGETYAGFYAPSLINMNKQSILRLFFTWADAYGHFTYFVDMDAANLNNMDISGFAMIPNNGNLSSGDDVTMMPNADFVYDASNHKFLMIKDYSPSASRLPRVSTRIELAWIMEQEFYTIAHGTGWRSMMVYDFTDTPDSLYERLYSGSIVSDEFGHQLSGNIIEIIYNISDLEADNVFYIFSQQFETFYYNLD